MLRVGLSGGIGAGKSAAARRLVALGAVLIDADRLARDVVAPGTGGLAEVVAAFGAGVVGRDGALDRPAMARRVFADPASRRRLEGIIHPRVRARTAELTAAAPPDSIVVNDVPLLVETGLAPSYHLVIVVEAAEETRVRRLVATRGMARDEALGRIRAQATDERRRAAADVLQGNDGTPGELDAAVDALWRDRLTPFEVNLRRQRAAPPGPAGRAGDGDRLAARIGHAAGPLATAVRPAVAPADVVEIEVVAAPGADPGALTAALLRAGFPPVPAGFPSVPAGGDRVYGNADPGRPAIARLA